MSHAPSRDRTLGRMIAIAASTLAACGILLAFVLPAGAAMRQPETAPSAGHIAAVDSVGITVSDLGRAIEFYTGVLDFRVLSQREEVGLAAERLAGLFGLRRRIARLQLGEESIELVQYLAPEGRPIPADSRSNDHWFQHIAIVVGDMDRAYAHLRQHSVRHASTGPQTLPAWNPNAGGISAFYFKDPEGHVLEIIRFPPGKGDPRWQRSPEGVLFLGIDHTAIVVAHTDQSLAFYRDTLGMRIVGTSENYGTEQEHLNNIFGARLRITALRADRGPGVELLEYLAPTDGRDYPRDSRSSDLWQWTTTMVTPSAEELERRLRESRTPWISPGVVAADGAFVTATAVRDPDGHALVIGEPATALGVGPHD